VLPSQTIEEMACEMGEHLTTISSSEHEEDVPELEAVDRAPPSDRASDTGSVTRIPLIIPPSDYHCRALIETQSRPGGTLYRSVIDLSDHGSVSPTSEWLEQQGLAIPRPPNPVGVDVSSTDASAASSTQEFSAQFSVGEPEGLVPIFQGQTAAEQEEDLRQWMQDGREKQAERYQREDELFGAPLQSALEALSGALAEFVDYILMASDGVRRLELLSNVSLALDPLSVSPESSLGPSHSATSLDYSLPDPPAASVSDLQLAADRLEPDIAPHSIPQASATAHGKRKATSSPGTPPKAQKRFRKYRGDFLRQDIAKREAIKATKMADEKVIRTFAGVRLAILEGVSRIEGMVWTHYDVTEVCAHYSDIARMCSQERTMVAYQDHFPSTYFRHPLLFDAEAARAHTLWTVLHHNRRYELANLLFDVLTIRFRDEYALSHILNAQVFNRFPGTSVAGVRFRSVYCKIFRTPNSRPGSVQPSCRTPNCTRGSVHWGSDGVRNRFELQRT
jgi:hypothetical protein